LGQKIKSLIAIIFIEIAGKQIRIMSDKTKLSAIEKIKVESDALRGTIRQSLLDEITGAIREDDQA
jgi:hypothetical protein